MRPVRAEAVTGDTAVVSVCAALERGRVAATATASNMPVMPKRGMDVMGPGFRE
jgi:hypothetical protein